MACTYKEFMNFKPKPFYGNEAVVGLTRWIEKIKSIFEINFCAEDCKVRFVVCTFEDATLSCWNMHVKPIGVSITDAISWEELNQLLIKEYYTREENQKIDQELWNLFMKDTDC